MQVANGGGPEAATDAVPTVLRAKVSEGERTSSTCFPREGRSVFGLFVPKGGAPEAVRGRRETRLRHPSFPDSGAVSFMPGPSDDDPSRREKDQKKEIVEEWAFPEEEVPTFHFFFYVLIPFRIDRSFSVNFYPKMSDKRSRSETWIRGQHARRYASRTAFFYDRPLNLQCARTLFRRALGCLLPV